MSGGYPAHVLHLTDEDKLFWVRTRVQQTIDDLNEADEPDTVAIERLSAVVEVVERLRFEHRDVR